MECRSRWRFAPGDRSEDAVEIFSQCLCSGELNRVVYGSADVLVAGQQSCSARPLEKVVRAGEIVSCEARPPVDRIDEIDDGVVTGEVERPTRRGDDDRRTIPDQPQSEVSIGPTVLAVMWLVETRRTASLILVAHLANISPGWRPVRVRSVD
jgi:hypothetical protein